jgi:hypothetical protein
MNNNHQVVSALSAAAELQAKRAKFQEKKQSCESMAAEISTQLTGMELAHSILEKRYLTDEANLAQVAASRQEIDTKRAELAEAERLAGLAAEAILEIDQEIKQAEQSIAAAQREYCAEQRNAAIAKIRADAALRKNLIAAMVANAGTGAQYTFNAQIFVQQYLAAIVPEIADAEVRSELDKFIKSNELV